MAEWARLELREGVLLSRMEEADTGVEGWQILVPESEAHSVWWDYHQAAGHANHDQTLSLLWRRFSFDAPTHQRAGQGMCPVCYK